MHPDWAEIVQAIASCGTAMIALGGVIFVSRQIRQVERTIRGSTHEALTSESFEVLKFLSSEPESYAYFYLSKQLDQNAPEHIFILYAAEIVANYLEHVRMQKHNMRDIDWHVWRAFIEDTLRRAPVVRAHFERHRDWYMAELVEQSANISHELTRSSDSGRKGT